MRPSGGALPAYKATEKQTLDNKATRCRMSDTKQQRGTVARADVTSRVAGRDGSRPADKTLDTDHEPTYSEQHDPPAGGDWQSATL